VKYSESELQRMSDLVEFFSASYADEIPTRIHSRGTDDGHGLGGPPFHPGFLAWLEAGDLYKSGKPKESEKRRTDHRLRVTRAYRKVRRMAPTEWFVLQLVCVHHLDVQRVTEVMNQRAEDRGLDERYTSLGVTALLASALDKMSKFY
jgi:hypothetical protein